MASPETLDFPRLLAPIPGDHPVGPALRDDPELRPLFFQLRDVRMAARDAERLAHDYEFWSDEDKEKEPAPDPPNWQAVLNASIDITAEKSKDLWVAAWMIEALARLHGFPGLRDGFRLVRELCENYWDAIHPRPDVDEGEDITATLSQLSSLNDILIPAIDQIPITADTRSLSPLTSADYRDASQRVHRKEFTLETFDRAVREGGAEFARNLYADIEAAGDQFARLDQLWDEKCGRGEDGMSLAPPTTGIKQAIADCRDRVRNLARDFLGAESESGAGTGGETEAGGAGAPSAAVQGRATVGGSLADASVNSREEAFRALVRVADYFKRTEPHSPVSYKLEEAVRWGKLALPELMEELIRDLVTDDSTRQEMFRRAGIVRKVSEET
jgi:type VI secretion system protein ImpA